MSKRYMESPLLFSNLSQQQQRQSTSESVDSKNLTKKATLLSKGKKKEQTNAMPILNTRTTEDVVIDRFVELFKKQTPKEISAKSEQLEILEKNFQMEISKCILEVCKAFVTKFREVLIKNIDLFSNAFTLLVSLFKYNQSTSFLSLLFVNLYSLLTEFNPVLWGLKNTVCGELIYQTLRHCNSPIKTTRDEAISFYIALVKNNIDQVGNFSRTRLQSTIAVTRLLGESTEEMKPCVMLLKGFKKATSHFKELTDYPDLHNQFAALEEQICHLVDRSQKIREFRYDPEMMCSLYYEISRQLLESPDERIAWLENLSTYYREKGNLEECAQTKIITAALVQEYLTLMKRWDSKLPAAFHLVCPNVEAALELPDSDDLAPLESEICQSDLFNHEGFVNLLKEAIQILKKGGFYESSVAAYQMMLPIFQESADYKKQRQCYGDLIELTEILTNETQINQRIFSTYYRVGFYGKVLGDLDEKEFIYKELNTTMVADFTERMIKQFQGKYGADNVVKLGNQPVPSTLDATKCYLQIGSVEPYFTQEELGKERNTEWKRAYNLRHFLMNQPFTKSGAIQGSHEEQWIRRTIFTTEKSFPFLEKRIEIISKRSIELSPIENAIELIRNKTQSLKSELNSHAPREKILQRDLQGTLLVQVNAGPKAIAASFLDESVKANFPQDKRFELTEAFEQLYRTLGSAVSLNRQMIGEHEVLQMELQKALNEFKSQLEAYPVFAERRAYIQAKEEQEAKAAQTTLGERAQHRPPNSARNRPQGNTANMRQAASLTLPTGATWVSSASLKTIKKPKLGVPEEGDDTKHVKKTFKHNSSNSIRSPFVEVGGALAQKDRERPSSSPRVITKSVTEHSEKVKVTAKEDRKHKEKNDRVSVSAPAPEAPSPSGKEKDLLLEPVPEDGIVQPQQSEPMQSETPNTDTASPRIRRTTSLPSDSPSSSPYKTVVVPKVVETPPTASQTDMAGDKFAKAKIGITGISRNVHSILTELNQTALKTEDLNTAITYVRLVKFMKEELSKAGEIIKLSPYTSTIPHPTKTDNKLELLKFHWQSNVEAVNQILKDINKEVSEVQQSDKLVLILKLLKKAQDEAKVLLSQPNK